VKTLFWDGQFCKRLSSTTSEQDFNQNVGEVACSVYLTVHWPIDQKVGSWLRNKVTLYIYPHFKMVTNKWQRYFFRDSNTLCLCWMLLCSNFTLLEFNPFGDATFSIDILMLLVCLCCSMTLALNFQFVFWTCFWSLSLLVFQNHNTFHVEEPRRTQQKPCSYRSAAQWQIYFCSEPLGVQLEYTGSWS